MSTQEVIRLCQQEESVDNYRERERYYRRVTAHKPLSLKMKAYLRVQWYRNHRTTEQWKK